MKGIIISLLLLTTHLCMGYDGTLAVFGGSEYNVTLFNPLTGLYTPILSFNQQAQLIKIIEFDQSAGILTYIEINQNLLIQQNIKSKKIVSKFKLPNNFDYNSAQQDNGYIYVITTGDETAFSINRIIIQTGKVDPKFEIDFEGVIGLTKFQLIPIYDFDNDKVSVWLYNAPTSPGLMDYDITFEDNVLGILKCPVISGCSYVFYGDLNGQNVTSEIRIAEFITTDIFIPLYLSADTIYGVDLSNGTGIATLNALSGQFENLIEFDVPYETDTISIVADFLDSTVFVSIQGGRENQPPYFIIYDVPSNSTISSTRPPIQSLGLDSIFAY